MAQNDTQCGHMTPTWFWHSSRNIVWHAMPYQMDFIFHISTFHQPLRRAYKHCHHGAWLILSAIWGPLGIMQRYVVVVDLTVSSQWQKFICNIDRSPLCKQRESIVPVLTYYHNAMKPTRPRSMGTAHVSDLCVLSRQWLLSSRYNWPPTIGSS